LSLDVQDDPISRTIAGEVQGLITHLQQYIPLIVVDHDLGPKDPLPKQYLTGFKALWVDAGVQKAIEKGNEFALHDNLT
jgi:hypothetical protein